MTFGRTTDCTDDTDAGSGAAKREVALSSTATERRGYSANMLSLEKLSRQLVNSHYRACLNDGLFFAK